MLQWGRAYKSAEFINLFYFMTTGGVLQWGRAYKSAEFALARRVFGTDPKLQWGRAYKSAEFSLLDGGGGENGAASMGPRLQERGVRRSGGEASLLDGGFNGAALTRARS